MASGIYTAMAGAVAQSQALDTTANNIANASTTGFRAERVRFGEALSRAKGKSTSYVQAQGGATQTNAGPHTSTGNALDLALHGEGYFAVQTPQGERLTRDGSFKLDETGALTTQEGYAVMGGSGKPINMGTDKAEQASLSISKDGTINAGERVVGKIDIRHHAITDMKREGNNLFSTTGKPVAGETSVESGQLEQGNFNVVTGMVDMVRISRTYESLHRMIEGQKEMDESIAKAGQ